MEEEENRQFAKFDRADEFLDILTSLLHLDLWTQPTGEEDNDESQKFNKLHWMLAEYQEQSYLMDPYLERMVLPTVNTFRAFASDLSRVAHLSSFSTRVSRLSLLIYGYLKTRGYKTIVRFFPHQVEDLSIALGCVNLSGSEMQHPTLWHLRYIILLWLSLICMIPFDLDRFDEDHASESTASKIENTGKLHLSRAGLEGDAAALLLARLYTRKDTCVLFPNFLVWATASVASGADIFLAIGLLHVLGEICKCGGRQQLANNRDAMNRLIGEIQHNEALTPNTFVRKWLAKLRGRLSLSYLPPRPLHTRVKGRILTSDVSAGFAQIVASSDDQVEIPLEVEEDIEEIFRLLGDRDTVVRWSAAKGLARISEHLPHGFVDQVFDTVLSLFSIHTLELDGELDIPANAENTWHGACLACAEFARRGLISDTRLPDLINWMSSALYFDVRKAAHSVGSSVRDAAAYVLWALARAQDPQSMQPFVSDLAHRLAAVSVYDREIHIRRAASAAFQENVGRQGMFPHGIDVLRKTDFYAVSVRRTAFLSAAPQVAEHEEYRSAFIDHLINISIRHWDPAMRSISAQSLRALCELDLRALGPGVVGRLIPLLRSSEANDVHGALLSLSELASAYRDQSEPLDDERLQIFWSLGHLPQGVLRKYGNELILAALCQVIANSLSLQALQLPNSESLWKPPIDQSLKHREAVVQEAAAEAMAALSKLTLCDRHQSLARSLGVLSYSSFPHGVGLATRCLLDALDAQSVNFSRNVEARRNAYNSLSNILASSSSKVLLELSADRAREIYQSFINGLKDYTIDERGDVGSWIRIASLRGLGISSQRLMSDSGLRPLEDWLPPILYHEAFSGILKQGSERLDNVRQEAGQQIVALLRMTPMEGLSGVDWIPAGRDLMCHLFLDEEASWVQPTMIYSKMVQLLDVGLYRKPVLHGIVLSIGSRVESTHRPASESLRAFASSAPLSNQNASKLSLPDLIDEIVELAQRNYSNNNLFIPALRSLEIIVSGDTGQKLAETSRGIDSYRKVLNIGCKNADKFKNVPRILASLKLTVSVLRIQLLKHDATKFIHVFLNHRFPTIRTTAAEILFMALQTHDLVPEDNEAEDILLETAWSSSSPDAYLDATDAIIRALEIDIPEPL